MCSPGWLWTHHIAYAALQVTILSWVSGAGITGVHCSAWLSDLYRGLKNARACGRTKTVGMNELWHLLLLLPLFSDKNQGVCIRKQTKYWFTLWSEHQSTCSNSPVRMCVLRARCALCTRDSYTRKGKWKLWISEFTGYSWASCSSVPWGQKDLNFLKSISVLLRKGPWVYYLENGSLWL